jgi:hypothetical protein
VPTKADAGWIFSGALPRSGRGAGLTLTTSFYWDMNDETRAWAKRFMERSSGFIPNLITAGTYASVLLYLKAVQAAGTDEGKAVAAKMRELPVNDFYNKNVKIRPDGRVDVPTIVCPLQVGPRYRS